MSPVRPFRYQATEAELTDLRDRVAAARWPEAATAEGWSQGVPLEYLRELSAYWIDGYDWRRTERWLNSIPQYRTEIDGLDVHFLHVRSPVPNAVPLVLTHGWPGSVLEFRHVVGPLTDPAAHGDDPVLAFDVVCPSLPGYGFSAKPVTPGWGIRRIAAAWAELMGRLGYARFAAAGSDWGTSISTVLGRDHAERVRGIHLVPPLAASDPFVQATPAEQRALDDLAVRQRDGSGYSAIHASRPQTVGYALLDSPVGLCGWLAEKFHDWADPASPVSRDDILDAVTLYWLTGTGASSARLYWESIAEVSAWFTAGTPDSVAVPTSCSIFPMEVPRVSRRWAERRFSNIVRWNELERGGHFPALEQPATFVAELRAFAARIR